MITCNPRVKLTINPANKMNGHFSEESLRLFAQLAAQTQSSDFAEGDTYDFTRCVRPNGTAYGTAGKCRKGTETAKNAKEKSGKTPHQIAKETKRNWPSVRTKYNHRNQSAKIHFWNTGGPVSSSQWVDSYLQMHGQEHNYAHDKVESFVDKQGNKHTITPDFNKGKLVAHTIEITPP